MIARVGARFAQQADGLVGIAGRAVNLDPGTLLEKFRKPPPAQAVVVDQDDADHFAHGLPSLWDCTAGNRSRTRVPVVPELSSVSSPPSRRARSRMIAMP